MEIRRIGIVMNGVTGRMGTNQHLARSISQIIKDGGIQIDNDLILMNEKYATFNPANFNVGDPSIIGDPRVERAPLTQDDIAAALPVRFDGSELMLATTERHLRRTLRFAMNVLGVPVYLVMASPDGLGRGLCRHYPWPGMSPASVLDDQLDRLLAMAG